MDNDLKKGIQLYKEQKFTEAINFFEMMAIKKSDAAEVAFYLGKIFLITEDDEKAITWLEKAVSLNANNSDYHLWLGKAYSIKVQKVSILKKPTIARNIEKELKRAVELNPGNLDARSGLVQFYIAAPAIVGGSKEKAKAQAEEIKKIHLAQGHLALGMIYNLSKEYELAEKEYLTAIEKDTNTFQAYHKLAYCYSENKNFDKAFEVLEKLVRDHPEETNAYFTIGKIAVMAGKNLDRAEECLKIYLVSKPGEDSPSPGLAHYILGSVYKIKGNKELATAQFEMALKLAPQLELAEEELGQLN